MQSLRDIRRRLKSIESTQKITRAMKMISISKLRFVQRHLEGYAMYFRHLEEILKNTASGAAQSHPFLRKPREENAVLIYLITADTGLCGAYNNEVITTVVNFMKANSDKNFKFVCIGKKGFNFCSKNGWNIIDSRVNFNGRYSHIEADKISQDMGNFFLNGVADSVYAAYTVFGSHAKQYPVIEKVLNIEADKNDGVVYSFEPAREDVLSGIVPFYLRFKTRYCLMSSFGSEHSARAMAMGEASDNAKELSESLILTRNKVRQAGITRDIIEVISSSEALKG